MMVFKLFAGGFVMRVGRSFNLVLDFAFLHISVIFQRELSRAESREVALDGLRGPAAFMVEVCHAGMVSLWIKSGHW